MSQDLAQIAGVPADARRWSGARLRLVLCLAVVVVALAWIAIHGLTGNFVYYLTPTDVVAQHKAHVGERVRLGGYVVPDSVQRTPSELTFTVTDGTASIAIS